MLNRIGYLLVGIFFVGAIVVSSNVVKTLLYDKREEIEILEFVGADDSWIYWPHLTNILILTFLCLGIAYGTSFLAAEVFGQFLSDQMNLQLVTLAVEQFMAFALVALLIQSLYVVVTVRSILPRNQRKKPLFGESR
ncbi:MAG: FtsX-like permease family protein [Pseudomonadota bacterium]